MKKKAVKIKRKGYDVGTPIGGIAGANMGVDFASMTPEQQSAYQLAQTQAEKDKIVKDAKLANGIGAAGNVIAAIPIPDQGTKNAAYTQQKNSAKQADQAVTGVATAINPVVGGIIGGLTEVGQGIRSGVEETDANGIPVNSRETIEAMGMVGAFTDPMQGITALSQGITPGNYYDKMFGPAIKAKAQKDVKTAESDVNYVQRAKDGGTIVGKGGKVQKKSTGGIIEGKGTKTSDSINAEFNLKDQIINADAMENDPAAKAVMKHLGLNKKAKLKDGTVPVKVSDGEGHIPAKDVPKAEAYLASIGSSFKQLNPDAEENVQTLKKGTNADGVKSNYLQKLVKKTPEDDYKVIYVVNEAGDIDAVFKKDFARYGNLHPNLKRILDRNDPKDAERIANKEEFGGEGIDKMKQTEKAGKDLGFDFTQYGYAAGEAAPVVTQTTSVATPQEQAIQNAVVSTPVITKAKSAVINQPVGLPPLIQDETGKLKVNPEASTSTTPVIGAKDEHLSELIKQAKKAPTGKEIAIPGKNVLPLIEDTRIIKPIEENSVSGNTTVIGPTPILPTSAKKTPPPPVTGNTDKKDTGWLSNLGAVSQIGLGLAQAALAKEPEMKIDPAFMAQLYDAQKSDDYGLPEAEKTLLERQRALARKAGTNYATSIAGGNSGMAFGMAKELAGQEATGALAQAVESAKLQMQKKSRTDALATHLQGLRQQQYAADYQNFINTQTSGGNLAQAGFGNLIEGKMYRDAQDRMDKRLGIG